MPQPRQVRQSPTHPAPHRALIVDAPRRPTPILISFRVWIILLILALVALVWILNASPSALSILLGGAALALVLSFPVNLLSRSMSRGWAILVTFLLLTGMIALALIILVPLLIDQLTTLIAAIPNLAARADTIIRDTLEYMEAQISLPVEPQQVVTEAGQRIFSQVQAIITGILTGLVSSVVNVFNLAIQIFGILFVAIYLLADIRIIKAAYLRAMPKRYRHDATQLWENFDQSLTKYLSGLLFVMALQGVLSTIALWIIGVPYALLIGIWVALTAIIPYLGAWLGAIPAIILALFQSPLTALLTAIVFLAIQQLEGNVLTPRIQGEAVHVHPIIVLLAVTAGGEIAGLGGIIFAVPTLAVLRVLFDFLRVRIRIRSMPQIVPPSVPDKRQEINRQR